MYNGIFAFAYSIGKTIEFVKRPFVAAYKWVLARVFTPVAFPWMMAEYYSQSETTAIPLLTLETKIHKELGAVAIKQFGRMAELSEARLDEMRACEITGEVLVFKTKETKVLKLPIRVMKVSFSSNLAGKYRAGTAYWDCHNGLCYLRAGHMEVKHLGEPLPIFRRRNGNSHTTS